MYFTSWDTFIKNVEELWRQEPLKTRFVTTYKHRAGILVLKVTDDKRCYKWKTSSQPCLNRLARLNALLLGLSAHGPSVSSEELLPREEEGTGGEGKGGGKRGKEEADGGGKGRKKQRGRRA